MKATFTVLSGVALLLAQSSAVLAHSPAEVKRLHRRTSHHDSGYGADDAYGAEYHEPTSVVWAHETTTSWHAQPTEHPYPQYGSGSWGTDYHDCVQQCQSQWNWHPTTTSKKRKTKTQAAHPTTTTWAADAYATGHATTTAAAAAATGSDLVARNHLEVVVAPKQGDLRFVPFAINARPGETINYVWGGGPHTVTQSTAENLCNASTITGAFKSGMQNKTFEFQVPVTTTESVFYFCAVGQHCRSGMFGIINPSAATVSTARFDSFARSLAANDTRFAAAWNTTNLATAGTAAQNWGAALDFDALPGWAREQAAWSVLETRSFYGSNPGILAEAQAANAASGGPNSATFSSAPAGSATSAGGASASLGAQSSAPSTDAATGIKAASTFVSVGMALQLGVMMW